MNQARLSLARPLPPPPCAAQTHPKCQNLTLMSGNLGAPAVLAPSGALGGEAADGQLSSQRGGRLGDTHSLSGEPRSWGCTSGGSSGCWGFRESRSDRAVTDPHSLPLARAGQGLTLSLPATFPRAPIMPQLAWAVALTAGHLHSSCGLSQTHRRCCFSGPLSPVRTVYPLGGGFEGRLLLHSSRPQPLTEGDTEAQRGKLSCPGGLR